MLLRNRLGIIASIGLIGHILIALKAVSPVLPVVGLMVIGVLLPGWLLWKVLCPPRYAALPFDEMVLGSTTGYALFVVSLLLLSYLPGGLDAWSLILFFDVVIIGLCLAWYFQDRGRPSQPVHAFYAISHFRAWLQSQNPWVMLGYAALLLLAAYLRLANLGFSEFQGDEAKMIMHAIGVLDGQEEVLFLHRKGPSEILLPSATFALSDFITETSARLPFAVVNILFVAVVALLGYRIGGHWVGMLAASMLALDGLFVGFGRIVQYTGFIFLMSAAVVYMMLTTEQSVRLMHVPTKDLRRLLVLAALYFGVGLLAHYEIASVLPPALYMLWTTRQAGWRWSHWLQVSLAPLATALVIIASFYLPFFMNPQIAATAEYYNSHILGLGVTLYNNLSEFWERSILYSAAPLVIFALALLILALGNLYWSSGIRFGRSLAILLMATAVALGLFPEKLMLGDMDVLPLLVVLLGMSAMVAPRASRYDRMLWLWFTPVWILAIVIIKKPALHYYIFYTPWLLIAALQFERLRRHAVQQTNVALANTVAVGLLSLVLGISIYYANLIFIEHTPELIRNWAGQRQLPTWLAATDPKTVPQFGFPHKSGWKTVGVLYQEGVLQGSYTSNMRQWIGDWYTRGAEFCEHHPDYVFIERNDKRDDQPKLFEMMGDDYALWGIVNVLDGPQLDIYTRGAENAPPLTLNNADYEPRFDQQLATAEMDYVVPAVTSAFEPVNYRFGDELEVIGIYFSPSTVTPGGYVDVELQMRAIRPPTRNYTLFMQIIGANDRMIGQRDRSPACDGEETSEWNEGTVVTSRFRIPIFADAPDGQFPLMMGMYETISQKRAPIYSADGAVIGDSVQIGIVEIAAQ